MKMPVLIEWEDICSWSGWNEELIDNDEDQPCHFTTVGFIIKDTDTKLTISDTYPEIGAVVTFPKGCIKSITQLKRG
jgi:hypothetical protein